MRRYTLAWPIPVAIVLVAATLAPGNALAQAAGSLTGEIRSEGNGATIDGATVEVRTGVGVRRTTSDARGRYTVRDLPAGRSILSVRHLGHAPLELEVIVPSGREVTLDLLLPIQPIALAPIQVEGNGLHSAHDSIPAREAGLGPAGTLALDVGPGLSELGIVDAVRGIPGKEPADPENILYVRGTSADLKLVYLDGAPVYAPFPLGGLIDPFAPDLLQRADIYLGGAPARFDGGLSYVMDLRTRSGGSRGFRTSGSLDLLSARVLAEGGFGDRATVIASGRTIHPLARSGLFGAGLPYEYSEGLIRMDLEVGQTGLLSATGFTNGEAVRMGESVPGNGSIAWGNTAASLRYRGTIGETGMEISAALGDYSAILPISDTLSLTATAETRRSRLSADFARTVQGVQLRYGSAIEHQEHHALATYPASSATSTLLEGSGTVGGVYAEAAGRIIPRLWLRAGGRIDRFSASNGLTVAPRVAATLLVTERAALTIAAGRYHQFLRPPDEVLLSQTESGVSYASSELAVGSSSHFTVALDQELGDGLRLGIEGFYKAFSGVPGAFSVAANASGADLWVRRDAEEWSGWLGYSLSWVWSNHAIPGTADFTGRHLLSTGVGGPIFEDTRLDLRFAYGAGLPYSGIPLGNNFASPSPQSLRVASPAVSSAQRGGTESAPLLHTPQQPFLRVDASLSQLWEPRLRGRTYEVTPYLRVLNTLGRRDALFYYFESGSEGSPRPVGTLPLVPVLGFEWRF